MSTILTSLANHVTLKRLLFLSCGLAVVRLRRLLYYPIWNLTSPLRRLSGPSPDNWFVGHFIMLTENQDATIWETWKEKYGTVIQLRGIFGEYHACIWDMRAINYVLTHNTIFPKSEPIRRGVAEILGEGILAADEESHKRQRRIMNPAFSALHVRNLIPTFVAKSYQLRDIWTDILHDQPEGKTIDVFTWLNRTTLDIIGLTGFSYDFRSLENKGQDELAKAYGELLDPNQDISLIKELIRNLLHIPTADSKRFDANRATVRRVCTEIMQDKKALLQAGAQLTEPRVQDLFTLLIKSNLAETDSRLAMSDEEVLGQIMNFLAAGHDSSSAAMAWGLYALAKYPEVQSKLRDELEGAGLGDDPSMDGLDRLNYLHNFVREVLRVYPVLSVNIREAAKDTVIPVGGFFRDSTGKIQTGIRVRKGDSIVIPILSVNRAKEVWGEDALEFNPDRWNSLPEAVKEMPGVWGHILTFFHGPHACIGFRFAVEEMKVLSYTLVRSFEFEIDPTVKVEGEASLAIIPCVRDGSKKVRKLPLLCRPVSK